MRKESEMQTQGTGTVGPSKVQERLAQVRADPEHQAEVAKIRGRMDQEAREYRMGLAAVRKAAELSQVELAARMHSTQPRVSEAESNKDMLLSTLANYLSAAGATDVTVQVTINGQVIELHLSLDPDRQQPQTS